MNDKREYKRVISQRRFAFIRIESIIKYILVNEIANFSMFCDLCSQNGNFSNEKEETITGALKLLEEYCCRIKKYIASNFFQKNSIPVDLSIENEKEKHLCLSSMSCYENLSNDIKRIIENKDIYFDLEVINEEAYNELSELNSLLQEIIRTSKAKNQKATIEYKSLFFKEVQRLDCLKINFEEKVSIIVI